MNYSMMKRDQAVADDYLSTQMACRVCQRMVETRELSAYGARCFVCYDKCLGEKNPAGWPSRPLTPDERMAVRDRGLKALAQLRAMRSDPKAWARDLQRREEAGEVLTTIQSQSWKEALKPRIELEETL